MYVLSSLETSEVSQDSTFVSCFTVLGMSCMCSGNNCQENESTYFTQVLFYIWFFLINTVNIIIFAPATDDFNVPSCFCVCFSIEYAVARKLYLPNIPSLSSCLNPVLLICLCLIHASRVNESHSFLWIQERIEVKHCKPPVFGDIKTSYKISFFVMGVIAGLPHCGKWGQSLLYWLLSNKRKDSSVCYCSVIIMLDGFIFELTHPCAYNIFQIVGVIWWDFAYRDLFEGKTAETNALPKNQSY